MAITQITAPYLWSAGTIWPPVCAVLVAARFATRKAQKAPFGWDDLLTLPALVFVWGMAASILAATAQHGLGYPTPPASPGEDQAMAASPAQVIARKAYTAVTLLQTVALTFIKLSCMLFYRRMFRTGSSRFLSWFINTFNVLTVIWGFGFFFSFMFGCGTHFYYLWTSLANQLKCHVNLAQAVLAVAGTDFVMDVILFVFPIPLVLRMNMSTGRKLALLGIFLMGAAAVATSILRLVMAVLTVNAMLGPNADQNLATSAGIYFQFIETCFALCAICLPSVAGAFKLPAMQRKLSRSSILLGLPSNVFRGSSSGESQPRRQSSNSKTAMSMRPSLSTSLVETSKYSTSTVIRKDVEFEVAHADMESSNDDINPQRQFDKDMV